METFSIILKCVMLLIAGYYFVRPKKLLEKRPGFSPIKVRILLGFVICLLLAGFFLQYKDRFSGSSSALTQKQQEDVAKVEAKLTAQLEQYPKEIQQSGWTKACQKANVEQVLKQTPNMPQKTADLFGLTVCSCMAKQLGGAPEFKKSEEMIAAGKSFVEAMDASFALQPSLVEKIMPCQELGK